MSNSAILESLLESAPDPSLGRVIVASIEKLVARDNYLLAVDANERSITHRLAIYLQEAYPDWDVDCEYNRDGHEPKRINMISEAIESNDEFGRTVFPDIIVHKRGPNNNFLAIEVKKTTSTRSPELDFAKLQALKEQLGYRYALYLLFITDGSSSSIKEFRWI